jgi:hypothetical protein
MGVPTLEVGYTSTTTGRGDHEVHKGHVVALEKKETKNESLCRRDLPNQYRSPVGSTRPPVYWVKGLLFHGAWPQTPTPDLMPRLKK